MKFDKRFTEGQNGEYRGLDNGLGRINNHIYNVQKKWYYLIGGLSGTGKTTLVDSMLQAAIRNAEDEGIEIDIFYYSYEIDSETKFAQWLSNHVYAKHNIEIPPEKIAGLGNNILPSYQQDLVRLEIPYMEKIFNKINFRFDPTNPTGIYRELFDYYSSIGEWEWETYKSTDESGKLDSQGNPLEVSKTRIAGYKRKKEGYTIVVLDHLALCKIENKYTLKENIDRISQYAVWLRNICGTTFFMLQQFNQGLNSIDRKKYNGEDLLPQQNDFKDSGNPFQDSDTALGIMNPHAMNTSSTKVVGYDLREIKRNFRLINIIKNRKGKAGVIEGYYFNPKTGHFKSLPDFGEISKDTIDKINNGNL